MFDGLDYSLNVVFGRKHWQLNAGVKTWSERHIEEETADCCVISENMTDGVQTKVFVYPSDTSDESASLKRPPYLHNQTIIIHITIFSNRCFSHLSCELFKWKDMPLAVPGELRNTIDPELEWKHSKCIDGTTKIISGYFSQRFYHSENQKFGVYKTIIPYLHVVSSVVSEHHSN